MSEPDLVVEDLTVRYGPVEAVRGVSLQVDRAAIVAIVGANGAGKSSALTALAGICAGSVSASVRLVGEQLRIKRPHRIVERGMVLVPEGRRMISPLSVQDNLLLGGYRHRSGRRLRALLTDVYDLFPILSERRDVPSGLLSGGEQQMLAFGRAMMADPRLMLMDEPTMGLSPSMTDRVMEAISAINERGVSVLLVEQNAAAALPIASFAYVLDRGEVVHAGPAREVSSDPILAQTFLGLRPTAQP
ncbi:ABC transporter ATP-binding protein [Micromonospora inositola]|uniref:Amino acid/amide ABC transporter ATP-binding protein 2, HAAT family n=1 Tax=Micromonospora inositola TaxID=47865 RepID=A0A1C5JNN7_9ACTN|nr:ABC transporter ATP-binding protein [Micromonospora inositola]SCG72093.1 amino acid/amide ABC transporter ATP-binding protein 2, HAAT family [Micromonospora inositola]